MFSFELLLDAIVLGVLLGCFYAAVSLGLSVAFGLLDVPHLAHPAFLVLGAYCTYLLDELRHRSAGRRVLLMPLFFVLGMAIYRFYYETFEKRGTEPACAASRSSSASPFIIEVGIILAFGVDQRSVEARLHRQGDRHRRHAHSRCA